MIIFHEAAGWVEYSKGSAIFVLLYSLHLRTKPFPGFEYRNDAFFYDHAINKEMPPLQSMYLVSAYIYISFYFVKKFNCKPISDDRNSYK